jgi:lipopolysaccharide transport system permease protein
MEHLKTDFSDSKSNRISSLGDIPNSFYRNRYLIYQLTRCEILRRYKESYLGILWSFLTPLLMLSIFTIVFGCIFNGKFTSQVSESRLDFALGLFCGLNVFNFFGECLQRAPLLIVSNPNYVTKTVFPMEVLPLTTVITAFVHWLISMAILLLGLLIFHGAICPTTILIIPLSLPLFLITLGFTWMISSLGVLIRDITALMTPLIAILMYASGIFYSIERVPPQFRWLVEYNPIAVLIEQTRSVILWGHGLEPFVFFKLCVLSLIICMGGFSVFMKYKSRFADYL